MESGVSEIGDIPWLTVEPAEGTLGTGGVMPLSVHVDTNGLEPGLYLGTLLVATNSGRQPMLRVPVSLVVSANVQAANSGGLDYVDGLGDTWSKDRAYVAGEWGYIQKGNVRSTSKDITGTDDVPLY